MSSSYGFSARALMRRNNSCHSFVLLLAPYHFYNSCSLCLLYLMYAFSSQRNWEAGGNCNMAIAAARLGLSCATIGHVGDEIYGQFLLDVLEDEGISVVRMDGENDEVSSSSAAYETLLCWVLVDPMQRHGFCRYDNIVIIYSWLWVY